MQNLFFWCFPSVWMSHREWFLNGNYLIIIVSVCIILPLAVMKQLGMFGFFSCPHILSFISHFLSCTLSQLCFFLILFYSLFFLSISLDFVLFISPQVTWATPVVFPSPAWCFSWFQWVLAKTLTPLQGVDPLINFVFSSAGDLQEIQHPVSPEWRARQHHVGRCPLCC